MFFGIEIMRFVKSIFLKDVPFLIELRPSFKLWAHQALVDFPDCENPPVLRASLWTFKYSYSSVVTLSIVVLIDLIVQWLIFDKISKPCNSRFAYHEILLYILLSNMKLLRFIISLRVTREYEAINNNSEIVI